MNQHELETQFDKLQSKSFHWWHCWQPVSDLTTKWSHVQCTHISHSVSLSSCLSLWMRSWQLAAKSCHYSIRPSVWEGSMLGHTHTSTAHTATLVCVIVTSRWVNGLYCMEDSKVIAAKVQPKETLSKPRVCVSAGRLAQHVDDNRALWPVFKEPLDLPTIVSQSLFGSNLPRGWRWAGYCE